MLVSIFVLISFVNIGTGNGDFPVACYPPFRQNGRIVDSSGRTAGTAISGTTIRLFCNDGYSSVGATAAQCQPNGQWDSSIGTCEANTVRSSCFVAPIATGYYIDANTRIRISGANVVSGTSVQIICYTGYTPTAASSALCQSNGQWSRIASCQALSAPAESTSICSVPPDMNGYFVDARTLMHISIGGIVTSGTMVRLVCNVDYEPSGFSSATCQNNGMWSRSLGSCQSSSSNVGSQNSICYIPPEMNGQYVDAVSNVPYNQGGIATNGNTVRLACNTGYEPSSPSLATCQSNGLWSQTMAHCQASSSNVGSQINAICYIPPEINGQFVDALSNVPYNQGGIATNGNTVRLTCNTGYEPSGSSSATCQSNGQWSQSLGRCQASINVGSGSPTYAICYIPPEVNGQFVNAASNVPYNQGGIADSGTTLKLVCKFGYAVAGNSMALCQRNGLWSNALGTCQVR